MNKKNYEKLKIELRELFTSHGINFIATNELEDLFDRYDEEF